MKLEDEKKRLAELEAEYERKKNVHGDQLILGRILELRRMIKMREEEEPLQTDEY